MTSDLMGNVPNLPADVSCMGRTRSHTRVPQRESNFCVVHSKNDDKTFLTKETRQDVRLTKISAVELEPAQRRNNFTDP